MNKELSKNTNNLHEGHKARLRKKALTDLSLLGDHEVLELLLNFTVVRKNTNDVAHELMNNYCSLSNVLDSNVDELLKVKGIGEASATLLSLLPQLFNRYKLSKAKETLIINNSMDYMRLLDAVLTHQSVEKLYALYLNKFNKIISLELLCTGEIDNIKIDPVSIGKQASKIKNCFSVILAHNHINNVCAPSQYDIEFTQTLNKIFSIIKIELYDHLIITDDNICSMREINLL